MKTSNIRWGRAILAGVLTGLICFFVGTAMYASVNGVYERFGDLPYAKQVTSVPVYLLQMVVVGGLVLNTLWAIVYAIIQEGLPGQNKWQKGLAFGLVLIAIKVLPTAFNTWMQIAQPGVLVLIEMVNSAINALVAGLLIAAFYGSPATVGQARKAHVG
ncbi:MAG: hypothetical protein SXV54_16160 [Chloroflexota bacterium]|nr:hypothetical protein [Chloroflexota bacterium]